MKFSKLFIRRSNYYGYFPNSFYGWLIFILFLGLVVFILFYFILNGSWDFVILLFFLLYFMNRIFEFNRNNVIRINRRNIKKKLKRINKKY